MSIDKLVSKATVLSLALVGLNLCGCATTGPMGTAGYALFKVDQEPGMATTDAPANKMGEACAQNILGIVAYGDASIDAAKKSAGITKVSTVDYDMMNFFVYGKTCTIVRGN